MDEVITEVSLLSVWMIAAVANASAKKLEKRGALLGGHDSGSANYLPPVPSYVSKPVAVPAPTYGVPAHGPSFAAPVPAPTYGVPAHVPSYSGPVGVPSYSGSFSASVPSFSGHGPALSPSISAPAYAGSAPGSSYGVPVSGPAPSYAGSYHHSLPASTYGVPHHHSAPVYSGVSAGVPAVGLSVGHSVSLGSDHGVSLGSSGLHGSYGLPSLEPAVGVSLGSGSYPSKSYGVPSGLPVGLSLGVPSKSYGVPAISHGSGLALGLGSLPSSSGGFGLSHSDVQVGHDDGYSYPVPSKKLLI
ncbi:nuclear pore complex protein Nup58-like isoform X1 [Hylaeus volcanicus]|uniref:nuclear pore complex protein Nup58-like isoform X1 n=2 Tax=Hylaeus volcanicus TaxID=313075 RepID=UPI0023B85D64|nr:nuclear pore complex protein Nup58-like isoform X1 [Hylaeus volcanicus]